MKRMGQKGKDDSIVTNVVKMKNLLMPQIIEDERSLVQNSKAEERTEMWVVSLLAERHWTYCLRSYYFKTNKYLESSSSFWVTIFV